MGLPLIVSISAMVVGIILWALSRVTKNKSSIQLDSLAGLAFITALMMWFLAAMRG